MLKKKNLLLIFIVILAFILRFYNLSNNPPSLYWEEVALGYDAYSLWKTGYDHRGNPLPIVYINSYMDYKPPLYIYAAIPSIAFFGFNELAVRLPSALAGTLTVLILYFLTMELFNKFAIRKLDNWIIGLTASFLLAISPWHLQFSRAAFEANLALFLIVLAIYLFFKSFNNKFLLLPSIIIFSLTFYCYHGARVFTPIIVLTLCLLYIKELIKNRSRSIFAFIIVLILTLPLTLSLRNIEIRQRFQETSVFTSLEPIIESNIKIDQSGGGRIAKLVYHRYWHYLKIFLSNYFQHFDGSYLFLNGDNNPRHSTQEFGLFYHWELITLVVGVVLLLINPKKETLFIFVWILLGIIPAAIAKATPHALRTLFTLPAYAIVSATGLVYLIKVFEKRKILLFTVYCLLFTEFALYLHFYHHHYPRIHSFHWQYGYKEAINFAKENEEKYDNIWLTDNYGRDYMYYLFFSKSDPLWVQKEIKAYKSDPTILKLGKYYFGTNQPLEGKNLYISSPGEIPAGDKKLLKTIDFLDGKRAFEIYEN